MGELGRKYLLIARQNATILFDKLNATAKPARGCI
jgi:hypothetical protein